MAASLDSYGNYLADLHYVSNSLGGVSGDVSIITGAPDANTPTWNPLVVDSNTGNYYSYYGGSWHLLSASGGSAKLTSGNGSPVGVVDPATYILYVQLDSTPPGINWYSDGANWH